MNEKISSFVSLQNALYAMLTTLAQNATNPNSAVKYREVSQSLFRCKTFIELTDTLGDAPSDPLINDRIMRMELSNSSRRFLNGRTDGFAHDWYAQYYDNPTATQHIASMIDQVADAYWAYVNFGIEPQRGNWHDNQCQLWSMLTTSEDSAKAMRARLEGRQTLYPRALAERRLEGHLRSTDEQRLYRVHDAVLQSGIPDMRAWNVEQLALFALLTAPKAAAPNRSESS